MTSDVQDLLRANQIACAKEETGCSMCSIESWGPIPARAMLGLLGWCLTVYSGEGYAAIADGDRANREGDRADGFGSREERKVCTEGGLFF